MGPEDSVIDDFETPEYRTFMRARVQRDTEARETLERAVVMAAQALQDAVAALERFDDEQGD